MTENNVTEANDNTPETEAEKAEREALLAERAERHAGGSPRPVGNAASREDIERAKKAAGF